MKTIGLNGKWKMKRTDEQEWMEAQVPGSVYNELLKLKKIEDPYYRDNEENSIEVARYNYEYERTFEMDENTLTSDRAYLCCEGLDTLSEIVVNGNVIAKTDNMHRTYEFDVKEYLEIGLNTIRIKFFSPVNYIEQKNKEVPIWGANAMEGFPHIRKAHYMFGWDWGPRVPDMGIWRDIYIKVYSTAKIEEVYITQHHSENLVSLDVRTRIENWSKKDLTVNVRIKSQKGELINESCTFCEYEKHINIDIDNPELWWPAGYGTQALYEVEVELIHGQEALDRKEFKIGLRTLGIRKEKDQWGESFEFNVNGISIFAMGANYIPEDNIIPRCSKERTEKLIKQAVEANMNCIRVWGGGFYQEDYFYDLCDEYGLIVWQDFMFACADYNLTDDFIFSISKEIEDNVKRIRHHASLGIWCGNNENEVAIRYWRIPERSTTREEYVRQYEEIIPAIVRGHDPNTFYWPSSPSKTGSFQEQDNENIGDAHYWDVWIMSAPFTDYRKHLFRFVSEFGFEAFPGMKTIESFTLPEDRNPFSYVMEAHQKHVGGNGKTLYYISEYLKYPKSFDSLLYASQIMQAEAIKYGVEHWRRNRGRCMGAIYWQLNDCWPVASWSSIDYCGRWKALHYYAKNFFSRVLVSVCEKDTSSDIFIVNETRESVNGTLNWKLRDNRSNLVAEGSKEVEVEALNSYLCEELDFSKEMPGKAEMRKHYLEFSFVSEGKVISEGSTLFVRPKHFDFLNPEINFKVEEQENNFVITVSAEAYGKFVELDLKNSDCIFSDNYFDISKGADRIIYVNKDSLDRELSLEQFEKELKVRSVFDMYE
jgi:beta-mannosidase